MHIVFGSLPNSISYRGALLWYASLSSYFVRNYILVQSIALGLIATVVTTVVEYFTAGYFEPPLLVSSIMCPLFSHRLSWGSITDMELSLPTDRYDNSRHVDMVRKSPILFLVCMPFISYTSPQVKEKRNIF